MRLISSLHEQLGLTVVLVTRPRHAGRHGGARCGAGERRLALGSVRNNESDHPFIRNFFCCDRQRAAAPRFRGDSQKWKATTRLPRIFTLLLGLASALAVFWLSGKREATNEYILVTQKSVSGLNTQAQVRFRGLRAGKVLDIELDPKNPLNILITISLDASMPVTKGTTAKLNYQGVTGLASVLLEDKGENLEPLTGVDGELPRIELQPNFAFPGENAADLMAQMRQVAERTTALLDQNVKRIGQTLATSRRSRPVSPAA